jgi:Arc/MetJ family transcription regulator
MRTTIDIDDDLLAATKELARKEGSTAGRVVSRLLRHSLTGAAAVSQRQRARRSAVAGFEPFAAKPGVVTTNAHVDALRDAQGV